MSGERKGDDSVICIDGNTLEGGGQILRLAVSLSVLMKKPINVYNIRGGRAKGGLRPQHLKGVQLACEMCNGKLTGAVIGSEEITFTPSLIQSKEYHADTETAGSVGLLAQVALPIALYGQNVTKLKLKGGTNADMAPPVDYTEHVFLPVLKKFGADCTMNLIRRGFYPKGGGIVTFEIPSVTRLNAVEMLEFGDLRKIWGLSYAAGVLPLEMAREMADVANCLLKKHVVENVKIDIQAVKENRNNVFGNGSGILLFAETSTGCILGTSCTGSVKIKPKEVATKAAEELSQLILKKVCVDDHLQDQLICLMALAKGKSAVKCGGITKHTRTAIFVAECMTEAEFNIIEQAGDGTNILECTGIGLVNSRR